MVEIRQLNPTRSNLKKFVEFQIDLYKGNPYFIPPLVSDEIATLDSKVNPAFDHCESAYFMAYRDGKPVGRIAAMINKQVNEKENSRQARFGFVDFIDDAEVSKALFDTAEQWAKEKGMDNIVGPLGFTDLDNEGMLINGFEELGTMATIYNYPYYPQHIERLGYEKEVDWHEFLIEIPEQIPDKHKRIA